MANPNTSSAPLPMKTEHGLSLSCPPTLTNPSTWHPQEATPEHAKAFAVVAYRELSPATPDALVLSTSRHLLAQHYTAAELAYALSVLPHDVKVGESIEHRTPNPYWLLPHINRIISRAREIRRILSGRLISEGDVHGLCAEVPGLEYTMFQRGGFNSFDEPLYRYAPGIAPSEEAKAMTLLHGKANA